MSDDELEEIVYWVGREIQEARRALWDGKSGKAFASIEAAGEEFEKLEEMIDNGAAENDASRTKTQTENEQ